MRLQTCRLPFQTFKERKWTKRVTFHFGAICKWNPMAIWFEKFSKSTKWKWFLPFLTLISLKALMVLRLRSTWICLAFTLKAMLTLKREFFYFYFFLKKNCPAGPFKVSLFYYAISLLYVPPLPLRLSAARSTKKNPQQLIYPALVLEQQVPAEWQHGSLLQEPQVKHLSEGIFTHREAFCWVFFLFFLSPTQNANSFKNHSA